MTRRLERAAALLRNTDRSVTEICLDVGLFDLGSFTTSFKHHFGLAPLTLLLSPLRHRDLPGPRAAQSAT